MKRCPKCHRDFDNALDFCLEDGTRLTLLSSPAVAAPITTEAKRPGPTIAETVSFPIATVRDSSGVQRNDEVETVVAKTDALLPAVSTRGHEVLEYAAIIIALAHNWWQWLYLEKQYVSSIMEYVLSANFLMWLLLLIAGVATSLIAVRQSGKKTYSYVSLVILAINLILFLIAQIKVNKLKLLDIGEIMKFFIDTANLDEIKEATELGLIDGVTTNPSLVAKEGNVDFKEHIAKICSIVKGDVSAEVTALDTDGMLKEGREYAKIAPNVVVKCPLTLEGLKACRILTGEGTGVNVTLCFSAAQAILAAKAGAKYISPFIGRLDDIATEGMQVIRDIVQIYGNYGFTTEVLAASIRSPMHIVDCALAGADVATIPFKVIQQLVKHPLTDKGLEAFLADWKKSGRE